MCFGIRDSVRVKAKLLLDAPDLGTYDCKIAKKSIELCVPAQTSLGEVRDLSTRPSVPIDPIPIGGTPAAGSYLCYALSCKRPYPVQQGVIDVFGIRTVDKFKAKRLCVPAQTPVGP